MKTVKQKKGQFPMCGKRPFLACMCFLHVGTIFLPIRIKGTMLEPMRSKNGDTRLTAAFA